MMQARFILILVLLMPGMALADHVLVGHAWIREAPPMARVMGGYAQIHNRSGSAVWITNITSPDFGEIQLHRSFMHKGMMRMQHVPELKIPARSSVTLQPGGYHLMLFSPKRALRSGDRVLIRFTLGNGRHFVIPFTVRKAR